MSGHDFVDRPHEASHQEVPIPGSDHLKWKRWPIVDALRVKPARERREGHRSSRFTDLERPAR